jgi:hypothetical protein
METSSTSELGRSSEPVATSYAGDEAIELAVDFINGAAAELHQQLKTGMLLIGDYVLRVFFGNDPDVAQRRGGYRTNSSFRTLAQHPRLHMSLAGLHNAVSIAIQERRLQAAGVMALERLTDTHKVELARLVKNDGLKAKIVEEVVSQHLSVRQMVARIRALNGRSSPTASGFLPAVNRLIAIDVDRWAKNRIVMNLSPEQKDLCRLELQQAQVVIARMLNALERDLVLAAHA